MLLILMVRWALTLLRFLWLGGFKAGLVMGLSVALVGVFGKIGAWIVWGFCYSVSWTVKQIANAVFGFVAFLPVLFALTVVEPEHYEKVLEVVNATVNITEAVAPVVMDVVPEMVGVTAGVLDTVADTYHTIDLWWIWEYIVYRRQCSLTSWDDWTSMDREVYECLGKQGYRVSVDFLADLPWERSIIEFYRGILYVVVLIFGYITGMWGVLGTSKMGFLRILETARRGSRPTRMDKPRMVADVTAADGTYLGQCFRVGDRLITAWHVVSHYDYVYVHSSVAAERVTFVRKYDLDLADAPYSTRLCMPSGKWETIDAKTYVMVGSTVSGVWQATVGPLEHNTGEFGTVEYSGTTLPGFSGSPYYMGKSIYGMHLCGGTQNLGWDGSYLKTFYRREEDTFEWLLAEMVEADRKGDKLQYEIRGDDVRVFINGVYHVVDRMTFSLVESEYEREDRDRDVYVGRDADDYDGHYSRNRREDLEELQDLYDDPDNWADMDDEYDDYYDAVDQGSDDDDQMVREFEEDYQAYDYGLVGQKAEPRYVDQPSKNVTRVPSHVNAVVPVSTVWRARGESSSPRSVVIDGSRKASLNPKQPVVALVPTPAPRGGQCGYTWDIKEKTPMNQRRRKRKEFVRTLKESSRHGDLGSKEIWSLQSINELIESYARSTGHLPPEIVTFLSTVQQSLNH